MKLFSNVYKVTQAALNLKPVNKSCYAYGSDRILPRRKKSISKAREYFILAGEVFRTLKI